MTIITRCPLRSLPLDLRLTLPSFDFFFFHATATTEIYTLSLHDALPILKAKIEVAMMPGASSGSRTCRMTCAGLAQVIRQDRKSTRLNSSHQIISYAVFCLKKKKIEHQPTH